MECCCLTLQQKINEDTFSEMEQQNRQQNITSSKDQQITLQIGSYSNYVGSHFWNFQDDIFNDLLTDENHDENAYQDSHAEEVMAYQTDRMYQVRNSRASRMSKTPRVLIIDHRGSLGSFNPNGSNDEQNADITTWHGDKSIINQVKEEKNLFLQMLEKEENYFWSENKNQEEMEQKEDNDENDDENLDDEIRIDENTVKYWTDYLKVRFHPASICELPFWPISQSFETYSNGTSSDIISPDKREEYFDHVRRLVEECDWLRNITVIADLFDGFGGITCSLCEEIRDELPRITMPIWAFTDDASSSSSSSTSQSSAESRIQQCNIPICYSNLLSSDIASLLVPMSTFSASSFSPFIDSKLDVKYHTSAIFASAIETATGFQRLSSASPSHSATHSFDINIPEYRVGGENLSDVNWISELTSNHQYRLCTLEACVPFPINPVNQNNFAPLWDVFSSDSHRQQRSVINPFMSSLSSAVWGSYAAKEGILKAHRSGPPITNVLNCRGFQSSFFTSQMMSIIQNSTTTNSFRISSIHQRSYGLPIPISYPSFFRGVGREGFVTFSNSTPSSQIASVLFPSPEQQNRVDQLKQIERERGTSRLSCDSLVGLTGMGFDSTIMTSHVDSVLTTWRDRGVVSSSILTRSGMSLDECNEIDENLASLMTKLQGE